MTGLETWHSGLEGSLCKHEAFILDPSTRVKIQAWPQPPVVPAERTLEIGGLLGL